MTLVFLNSCQIGEDTLDTSTGNPLTSLAQYLDVNNDKNVQFYEAYTQDLKAAEYISKEIPVESDLNLIDFNGDKIFSQEEYDSIQLQREEIFKLQDGEIDCTTEQVVEEFAEVTNNFLYYNPFWAGIVVERSLRAKCLSTNYNGLLFKALRLIDRNRDSYIDEDEFHQLYGQQKYSKKESANLWNYDYSGELKKTIFHSNDLYVFSEDLISLVKAHQNIFKSASSDDGLRYINQFLADNKNFYEDVIKSYQKLRSQVSLFDTAFANRYTIMNYSLEDYPEFKKFDLNEDGHFTFVDKFAIDFVIQTKYFDKFKDCHYVEWSDPIPWITVNKVCKEDEDTLIKKFKIENRTSVLDRLSNETKKEEFIKSYKFLINSIVISNLNKYDYKYKYVEYLTRNCGDVSKDLSIESSFKELIDLYMNLSRLIFDGGEKKEYIMNCFDSAIEIHTWINLAHYSLPRLKNDLNLLRKSWKELFPNDNSLKRIESEILELTFSHPKALKIADENQLSLLDLQEVILKDLSEK